MQFPKVPRTGLGLRDVAAHAYRASTRMDSSNPELSPVESLAQRSQALHAIRQAMAGMPGGYSKAQMSTFDTNRSQDPAFREETIRLGEYPEGVSKQDGIAAEAARRAAQGAGMLAADITSQGAQSLWWFTNAAQAAAAAAGQQAMHYALRDAPSAPKRPFSRQHYAVSAAFPLVLGASAAVGNLYRQPGYTAVLDDGEDRRESTNPILETGLRSIGMSGSLLPFKEFTQERPDVSRDEYEAYKAYVYGSPMPLKFNPDGIHGAEINLVGKSIPLLTGVLPIAAGVAGGALGVRMAGKRLANAGKTNQFSKLNTLDHEIDSLWNDLKEEKLTREDRDAISYRISEAKKDRLHQLNKIEDALLLGAVTGSSAGLITTGAGAALLEQMRRAANAEENRRKQAEELALGEPY